jgi:hypothetical protein
VVLDRWKALVYCIILTAATTVACAFGCIHAVLLVRTYPYLNLVFRFFIKCLEFCTAWSSISVYVSRGVACSGVFHTNNVGRNKLYYLRNVWPYGQVFKSVHHHWVNAVLVSDNFKYTVSFPRVYTYVGQQLPVWLFSYVSVIGRIALTAFHVFVTYASRLIGSSWQLYTQPRLTFHLSLYKTSMSEHTQEVINMEARPGDRMDTGALSPTRLDPFQLHPRHGV